MKEFIPVSEEELFEVNGRGGSSKSSSKSSSSRPSPAPAPAYVAPSVPSVLEKKRVDAAVTALEVTKAKELVAKQVPYGAANNEVGKTKGLGEKSYDCSGAMAAVTGKGYQPTAALMDPKVQAATGYVQVASNAQAGTWTVVQYSDPATGKTVGHAQMTLGDGKYFDSVPKNDTRQGPSITSTSTVSYLQKNGITPEVVYLRPTY